MTLITNLPALLETDELEELLELPPETNFNDFLERETIETEAGKVHTGRGRIPIIISSKEHQEKLFNGQCGGTLRPENWSVVNVEEL